MRLADGEKEWVNKTATDHGDEKGTFIFPDRVSAKDECPPFRIATNAIELRDFKAATSTFFQPHA